MDVAVGELVKVGEGVEVFVDVLEGVKVGVAVNVLVAV